MNEGERGGGRRKLENSERQEEIGREGVRLLTEPCTPHTSYSPVVGRY